MPWTRSSGCSAGQPGLGAAGGLAADAFVEQSGDLVEGRLVDRVVGLERDECLLDRPFAEDQDQARHPFVDGDEVDPADMGLARLGRRRQPGRAGHRGEGRGGQPEPVLAGEFDLSELVADHELLDRRQRHGLDDRFDVEAVAGIGRDATRRGIRVGQQPVELELGQDAAHGRTGHAEPVALDERLTADRRDGRDVFLDDGPKDRLRADIQGAEGAMSSRQGLFSRVG